MKTISKFLLGVLVMCMFSGTVYAGNTAGGFQLPFDPNQRWKYANGTDCPYIGYKTPADQIFMQLYSVNNKYHLAEDQNGQCGGSTDLGGLLFAAADGKIQYLDNKNSCLDQIGKILIIRYTLPDGTYRDHVYEHLQSILVTLGATVTKGQQVATLGDGNGCYAGAAHFHEEMRRDNSGLSPAQNPYYPAISIRLPLEKYSSPSLFIDDRRYPVTQSLINGAWTYIAWYLNAPSSTAFIEYNGERYSLKRAVQLGYIYQYLYEQRSGQWYYYPDITNVFFGAGNTYAVWSFVNGAVLNILVPGSNFKDDRAKIDMIRAVSVNSNFKNVKADIFKLHTSDSWYDYWYMQFTYNNGSGDQPTYANQATLKSNPMIRYTVYYDPTTGAWNGWTQVNPNMLD